jgi:hypothetical protein
MRKRLDDIRVGNEFRSFVVTEFESMAEAVWELGEEKALLHINYSYNLTRRANERAKIVEEMKHKKGK